MSPKVVWTRLGNCTTTDVEQIIRRNFEGIRAFYEDEQAAFLIVSHGLGIR